MPIPEPEKIEKIEKIEDLNIIKESNIDIKSESLDDMYKRIDKNLDLLFYIRKCFKTYKNHVETNPSITIKDPEKINLVEWDSMMSIFNLALSITNEYYISKLCNKITLIIVENGCKQHFEIACNQHYIDFIKFFYSRHKKEAEYRVIDNTFFILRAANIDTDKYSRNSDEKLMVKEYPIYESWDVLISLVNKINDINFMITDEDKISLTNISIKNDIKSYIDFIVMLIKAHTKLNFE